MRAEKSQRVLAVDLRLVGSAAAAGYTRLGLELAELNTLAAAHAHPVFLAALERATAFGRWHSADVRSTLAAGTGTPKPRPAGTALVIDSGRGAPS